MPSMQSLYSGFDRDDFEILAISSDVEGASVVKPFMEALHLTFPALIDADFQVTNLYQVRAVPATFLIDREGVITHRFLGAKMWNDQASRDLIRKLIQSN
jgi:peroxiredoxin